MLNKDLLQNEILSALNMESVQESDPVQSRVRLSESIATAIDNYVKGASIKYVTGLAAPNGPVTGTFTGNLE